MAHYTAGKILVYKSGAGGPVDKIVNLPAFVEIESLDLTPVAAKTVNLPAFVEIESLQGFPLKYKSLAPFVGVQSLDLSQNITKIVNLPAFVEIETLDLTPAPDRVVLLAPFVEIDQLALVQISTRAIALLPFVEVDRLSLAWRTITPFTAAWAIKSSLEAGKYFILPGGFEAEKHFALINTICGEITPAWAIKNTLGEAAVTAAWAIKNEIVDTDSVTAVWAMKNTIGNYSTPGGPGDFWGQGPVVHRPGSRGGYE